MKEPKGKQIGIKLNPDLWRAIRKIALDQDRTATEVMEDAMRQYIHNEDRKHKAK